MRLLTVNYENKNKVAVEYENQVLLLEKLGIQVNNMNELIDRWDEFEPLISARIRENKGQYKGVSDYKLLSPLLSPRQDVICLGVNYKEHIEETEEVIDFSKKEATVYFSKRVNSFSASGDRIPNYNFVNSLDYEVELGVILKRDAFQVSVEEAKDYIFGYTIINDVSARNLQLKHSQWYFGKSLDGYTPMGPAIVTKDEIGDAHNLDIRLWVNDELRQESNTKYMITSVEEAISELSQGMTLKSGTVIATGTPGGVGMGMTPPGFLKSGDVVRCEIENIGAIENTVWGRS